MTKNISAVLSSSLDFRFLRFALAALLVLCFPWTAKAQRTIEKTAPKELIEAPIELDTADVEYTDRMLGLDQPTHTKLLYRLSKEGQPVSWLFGTMHSSSEQVAGFSRNLLDTLLKAELFVGEITNYTLLNILKDPNAAGVIPDREAGTIAYGTKLSDVLSKKDYKAVQTAFLKATGKPLRLYEWAHPALISIVLKNELNWLYGDLPYTLDGALLQFAHRNGLEVTSIERVSEQLDLFQQLMGSKVFQASAVAYAKALNSSFAWGGELADGIPAELTDMYRHVDPDSFLNFVRDGMTPRSFESMYTKRNLQFKQRIDSLLMSKSCFVAVGLGHLPGETGLIKAFRDDGWEVSEVALKFDGSTYEYLNDRLRPVDYYWFPYENEKPRFTVNLTFEWEYSLDTLDGRKTTVIEVADSMNSIFYSVLAMECDHKPTADLLGSLSEHAGKRYAITYRPEGEVTMGGKKAQGFRAAPEVGKYAAAKARIQGKSVYLIQVVADPDTDRLDQRARHFLESFSW